MFGYNPEKLYTHLLSEVTSRETAEGGMSGGEKEISFYCRLPLACGWWDSQNTHELKHKQPYGNKQLEKDWN